MAAHGHDKLSNASRRAVARRGEQQPPPLFDKNDASPARLSTQVEGVGEGVQVENKVAAVVVVLLVVCMTAVAVVVVLVVVVIVGAFVVVLVVTPLLSLLLLLTSVFLRCCCIGIVLFVVVVVSCYENVEVVGWRLRGDTSIIVAETRGIINSSWLRDASGVKRQMGTSPLLLPLYRSVRGTGAITGKSCLGKGGPSGVLRFCSCSSAWLRGTCSHAVGRSQP